jgi:hypothetical protein
MDALGAVDRGYGDGQQCDNAHYPVDFGAIFAKSGGLPLPQRSCSAKPTAAGTRPLADHLNIPSDPAKILPGQRTASGCVIAVANHWRRSAIKLSTAS